MKANERELEAALYAILTKQAQIILNLDNLSNAGSLDIRIAEQSDYAQRIEGYKAQKRALYEWKVKDFCVESEVESKA